MRLTVLLGAIAGISSLVLSCATQHKPVPPPNTADQQPWNIETPGHAGGPFSALPQMNQRR